MVTLSSINTGSSELDSCAVAGLDVDMSSLKFGDFSWPGGYVILFYNICQPGKALPSEGHSVMRRCWSGYLAINFTFSCHV